jgi:hypothetical protein
MTSELDARGARKRPAESAHRRSTYRRAGTWSGSVIFEAICMAREVRLILWPTILTLRDARLRQALDR